MKTYLAALSLVATLALPLAGCGDLGLGDHLTAGQSWPIRGAPGFAGAGRSEADHALGGLMECYYGADDGSVAAALEYVIEARREAATLRLRLTFSPRFVDNTFGANTVGWGVHKKKSRHPFSALHRSDHADLVLTDGDENVKLRFRADYLSADPGAASGFATRGLDGDGAMLVGAPSAVVDISTSLHRNLNERGYGGFTSDSPPTDASYTPSKLAPNWDYRVVYEAWVTLDTFGAAGFGAAHLLSMHASPAKRSDDTLDVRRGPCPTSWQLLPDVAMPPAPPVPDPAALPPPVDSPL